MLGEGERKARAVPFVAQSHELPGAGRAAEVERQVCLAAGVDVDVHLLDVERLAAGGHERIDHLLGRHSPRSLLREGGFRHGGAAGRQMVAGIGIRRED